MDKEIAIAWIDLTFSVKSFLMRKEKVILKRLNGSVDFGSLNALMGPSGAGKTTLLKCINGINKSGLGENSKIYLNSREKINSCLIANNEKERLIVGLTAKQNLIYASKLKNSGNQFKVNHENNVNDLLSELMTSDIANTNVEDCSGGEQRRLLIALELTSHIKPNLLCIDEPTSGLDSNAAEMVIEYLKLLSRRHNITVITSIHQPNSDVLMMFDKLYVLAKGGVCVYSGRPQDLNTHLRECDILCNKFQFPIEVLLKIGTKGVNDKQVLKLAKKSAEEKQSLLNRCENETKLFSNGIPFKSKNFKLIDMWYLLLRSMTYTYLSQWKVLLIQLVFYIITPLILAKTVNQNIGQPDSCYNFNENSTESCINELEKDSLIDQNLKFQAFTTVLVMFIQICVTTLTFPAEIKRFMSEHQNKWYSTGSFYLSKNLVELFPTIIYSICYAFIAYYSSGQIFEYSRLLWYIYIIVFGMLCAQGLGYLVGMICIKYEQIAIAVSIGLYLMLCMFCNIFTPIKEMPQLFQMISDISFNKFVYYSVLILIYGFGRCPSNQLSLVMFKYDMNEQLFWSYTKYIVIYFVILRILAYIVLYIRANTFFSGVKLKNLITKCFEYSHINRRNTEQPVCDESKSPVFIISSESSIDMNNSYEIDLNNNFDEDLDKKLSIAWIDLTLKTQNQLFSDEKIILRQLNGSVEFGSLNALMGPSGSGKTSLLRCLNGRYHNEMSDETKIYLSKFKKIRTCFISQDASEHLLKGLTAKQALIYASKLKNSDKELDHENSIKNLMIDLLITDIEDTNVEKCSKGEQKRLVMAMEMTSYKKPNLICIDEPTSGLDSNAAEVVIKCLKALSRKHNITIIISIHQPNSDVLMMFDMLYVLAKGGNCVYSGRPQDLNTHLNECGIKCTEFQVPIEVLLKHACNGSENKQVLKLVENTYKEKQTILSRCENEALLSLNGIQFKSKRFKLIDFWYLLLRVMTYTYRYYWKLLVFKLVLFTTFGYALTLFFRSDIGKASGCLSFGHDFNLTCHKTVEKLEEESLLYQNISYNLLVVMIITFQQIVITTLTFTTEVKMFLNEHRNGWYSTGSYYWAKSIEEFIPTFVIIIAYIYIIDIFDGNSIFFGYLCFITVGVLSVQSIGHIYGIIFNDNIKIAVLFSVSSYIILFLLSNYFVPIKELHYTIQCFSNLSTVKLMYENIIILFYGFDRCSGNQFSSVLFVFGLNDNRFYENIRILIFELIALRVLALIVLLLKVNTFSDRKRAEESQESVVKSSEVNLTIS